MAMTAPQWSMSGNGRDNEIVMSWPSTEMPDQSSQPGSSPV